MRVGIMCHSSFGGSVRIATELAKELARRGHRVHLFSPTTPLGSWDSSSRVILHRTVQEHKDEPNPTTLYTDWSTAEFQAFLSCLLEVIAKEGLDLLHFHYAIPFASLAIEVKRRLGDAAPLIIGTLHGSDVSVFGRDPVKGPLLAKTLRNADMLTTVSFNHARLATQLFGLPAYPEIIPDFVDLSRFKPRENPQTDNWEMDNQRKWGKGRVEKVRIAHISNFRPVKDVQSMARIFLGIREKLRAELWLIGDGQEMEIVRSIFKQRGAVKDVRYWGLYRNVAPLLSQTDLMVISSRAESFCLAALEAMACGLPVLATRTGGLPEVVVDGKTGFLFPVGDHSSAVELAVDLLSDLIQYSAMRKAAFGHAQNFGQKQIVSLYEDLYKTLLDKSSSLPVYGEPNVVYRGNL